jgi:hypothetical protein
VAARPIGRGLVPTFSGHHNRARGKRRLRCPLRRSHIGRRFVYRSHRSRSRRLLDHVPRSGGAGELALLGFIMQPRGLIDLGSSDGFVRVSLDPTAEERTQHPLQMLLIFLSTLESTASSSRIALSPRIGGPLVTVPSIRLPPPLTPAPFAWPIAPWPPFVTPPLVPPAPPEEFAVPALLVPGGLGILEELPAPDGSLPELFSPAAFAGPEGMPLTP